MGCQCTMQNHDDQNVTIYAGFFVRLAAYLIDSLVVGAALLFFRIPMWVIYFMDSNNIFVKPVLFVFGPCDILLYLLGALYFILMTYYAGATLGKKALNIKVISADEDKLTLITVIYRETIGKYLSGVIMCIGYILIGVDKEKRALHDTLCDTRVIYTCKMKLVYPPANTYGYYGGNAMPGYMQGYPQNNQQFSSPEAPNQESNQEANQEQNIEPKEESQETPYNNNLY